MAHMTMEFATSAVLSTAVRRRMDPAAYDHKPHRARARYVRRFGGDASATDEEVAAAELDDEDDVGATAAKP